MSSRGIMRQESEIRFHVCDVEYAIPIKDVSPETTLNSYLRDKMNLSATKKMCLEGGCGVCVVAVEETDSKGNKKTFAVNSCLVSIYSCHGWKIVTNEGIGNPLEGFHKIQKLLASNNGSQCGFCSSGMVMNMYALSESGGKTREEIENSFGGNLCRCTGYRSILTAFKQLATDSDDIMDIDDLEDFELCDPMKCQTHCPKPCKKVPIYFDLEANQWLKVYTMPDLLNVLRTNVRNKRYMLVAGNTARGIYWLTEATTPEVYIDVSGVYELTTFTYLQESLVLGGNVSLTSTMDIFRNTAKKNSKFVYLDAMANHIDLVAHVPVRNIGTLAGNLMTKHQHNEFPSDIFLILETVNATLVIVDLFGNELQKSPAEFLKIDMDKKVIKQIVLQPYGDEFRYTSYKIMPKSQNAHAMVNAGFLFQLTDSGIVTSARIAYGAINPSFIHASETEALVKGKQLFDNNVLQSIFKSLDREIQPDWVLPDPSPKFRKLLAINLFYKFVLSIALPSKLTNRNKSGGTLLIRPVSNGTQQIYPKKDLYPLTQPIQKLEALNQTSGQAKYILDLPELPGQLYACFVKANAKAGSRVSNIDATLAFKRPDVVAFYTAKDIPGINNIRVRSLQQQVDEKVFCEDVVEYYFQPIGVLIATSHEAAIAAASLVKVNTTPPLQEPLLTIQEVLKAGAKNRITKNTTIGTNTKGKDIQKTIKGQCNISSQYHFHMENQNCVVIPTEDGLNVFAGTQWMDHIQGVISQVLKLASQQINLFVRRLGGGFGAKITRNAFVSAATALAAYKLRKPVSMWMSFNDNMDVMGKRYPLHVQYEVDVNNQGEIQYLKADLYSDFGIGGNDPIDNLLVTQFASGYKNNYFTYTTYSVRTDNYAHCYARAPGTFEGLAAIENIMDHIAYTLNKDPLAVRRANLDKTKYKQLDDILNDVENNDHIAQRKANIELYNKENRWKKKGLSVVPMRWYLEFAGNFTTLVSIYHLDGGVVISHGGIEMGQGINTKVAQVCAYKFSIPLEKISVKPSYNVASPNSAVTGGSLTSEAVVGSVINACDILLSRIKPIRDKNPSLTWDALIQKCFEQNICLSSPGFFWPNSPGIGAYSIFGACALEVEVDILTGKHEILRTDIVEDVGQSMSPLIDIGQLEGAFIMGLGAHSSEELIYDAAGKLTNDRTWTYKVPGAKDIPQVFNVRFTNNSLNPLGVLNSKAIAEPPLCLTVAFPLAIRNALASARQDASPTTFSYYPIEGPSSVENILVNTLDDYTQYTL